MENVLIIFSLLSKKAVFFIKNYPISIKKLSIFTISCFFLEMRF